MCEQYVVLPPISDVAKFKNQDFEKLRSYCTHENVLWEDPMFKLDTEDVTWQRPWTIASSPCLFRRGQEPSPVRQGRLGNSYMVAAMQALASQPDLLHWVVPQDQACSEDGAGVAHFRIWQFGTWYDVCVDNRLPTREGKLAYAHSDDGNEFWGALLEKAYAKMYGSYESLAEGYCEEAMVDFSGGICETILIQNPPSELGTLLLKAHEMRLMVCCTMSKEHENSQDCSVKIDMKGLRHYTVIEVECGHNDGLRLRLKDPKDLSSLEDETDKWEIVRNWIANGFGPDFWISGFNFTNIFTILSICHLSPDTFMNIDRRYGSTSEWWVNLMRGEWVRGISAGGADSDTIHRNNQYRITLTDPDTGDNDDLCSLVVSLTQKTQKVRQRTWNLGFKLLKLENPISLPTFLEQNFFASNPRNIGVRSQVCSREIASRQQLTQGVYCIIPHTKNRNQEGEYLLRVFTAKVAPMRRSDRRVSVVDTHNIEHELVLNRVFPVAEETKTDDELVKLFLTIAGENMTIDWQGLKLILDSQGGDIYSYSVFSKIFNFAVEKVTSLAEYVFATPTEVHKEDKVNFSKALCRTLITYMNAGQSERIGFEQFDHLWSQMNNWKLIFRLQSKRKQGYVEASNLNNALEKLGIILSNKVLGILVHKYADEQGRMYFDDFVMCVVTVQLDMMNFEKTDSVNCGQVVVSENEWVRRSFSF